jgi:transcriptional regulator with XRE-family HTH domain
MLNMKGTNTMNAKNNKTFGQRLRSARESTGLTQDAAAKSVNVAMNTWHRWEADSCCPAADKVRKIARALGCDPLELLPE